MTAAVLLSGGMDSVALTFLKRPNHTITIDYGQKAAEAEIAAARQVSLELDIPHQIIRADCSSIGSGDMAGSAPDAIAPVTEWWPFRNQLLITLAAARGVPLGIDLLFLGSVASDDTHADGTAAFFAAIDTLMSLQEGKVSIEAPAIKLSTVELVRLSGIPRELLAWSHSCHTGILACGGCRGCVKHYQVMSELYGDAY